MIHMKLDQAKRGFFDRKSVIDATDKAMRGVLSRIGAYVRTRARTSIRYFERPSIKGMPPHGHRTMLRTKTAKKGKNAGQTKRQTVSPLRDFIFFSYDKDRRSVVIGPTLLNGRGGASVLEALEYGGRSMVRAWKGKSRFMIAVNIAARPFMRPALAEELKRLPQELRDCVRG